MHSLLAEVVPPPAVPAALYGLAALGTFVAFIALWGLQHGWDATLGTALRWLGDRFGAISIPTGPFGHVHPFGFVADAFHAVDHNVSHALAAAALSCQHAFVYTSSHAAQMARLLAHEVAVGAEAVYAAFHHYGAVTLPRFGRHTLRHVQQFIEALLVHALKGVAHSLATLLKALHLVRAQAHSTAVAVEHGFAWTRSRFKTAERDIGRLGRRLTTLEKLATVAGLTGLVAAVLSRLGLGWLRCSNVRRVGKNTCGMDTDLLSSLLQDTLLIAGTISLIEFIRDLQAVEGEALGLIRGFIREA